MKKYQMIYNDVKKKIIDGTYESNQLIPKESIMMETYNASRYTVKTAIDNLVSEGLVVKIRGSGSYVRNLSDKEDLKKILGAQILGFTKTHKDKKVHSELIHFDIVRPSKLIASKLQIDEMDLVYDISRIRYADEVPYVVERTYMPISIIPGLTKEACENSIFEFIKKELNIEISSAQRTVSGRIPTAIEKKQLEIGNNVVIMEVKQVGFLKNGKPLEYTIGCHRSDKYEDFYIISSD